MTVEELLGLIPEENRDEASQVIKGLNPLGNVADADSAVDFIKSHDVLKRGYDKIAQAAVDAHKRKFEEDRLPEMRKAMRDELLKELKPEETPEQKRLRELEEQLRERDSREKLYQLKEKLRAKAKEVDFDEGLAERFAYMQTDDPESELTTFSDRVKALAKDLAEKEIASRWPQNRPKVSAQVAGKITEVSGVPEEWTQEQVAEAIEKGVIAFE